MNMSYTTPGQIEKIVSFDYNNREILSIKMLNLLELKIFVDLAQEKNFVRTAEMNYLTQPSISSRLKHLEEALGVKLFERTPRHVRLTKDGEHLLPHAQELLLKCENLKTRAARFKNIVKGDLRVSTIYSIGIYELAPILKRFMRSYPDIHLRLEYNRADAIYDLVSENKIDMGLVAYPEHRPHIQITPFADDRMVLIVPPHHRFAKKRSIGLKGIKGEKFVTFDKDIPTRKAIDEILEKNSVQVSIRATNENVDTLKKAVEIGMGIAIVPCKTVREEVRKGTLIRIPFKDIKFERPLGILTLKNRVISPLAELFINRLTAEGIHSC
jgi:DNA-binding transcriptional LysR family regulator